MALFLFFICFVALSHPAYAIVKKQNPARTLSIHSGFIPPLTSNNSMWNLQMEFDYLGTGIFNSVGTNTFIGSNFFTRTLWLLGGEIIWFLVSNPVNIAQHELGHGARAAAIGGTPYYYWAGSNSYPSILPFMFQGVLGLKSGLAYTTYSSSSSTQPSDYDITMTAGGMNNSMMYAEFVEDEVQFNSGHILYYPSYLLGKLDTYSYAYNTRTGDSNGGDVDRLISYWASKGYGIGYSDLESGSLIAALGSFTNASMLWSFLRYIGTGDPTVYSPTIGSVKLPDLSFYQYRRGISMRSRFGFESSGNRYYPMSVEYVYKGSPAVEFSLGMRDLIPMAGVLKTGTLWQAFLSSAGGAGIRWSKDFLAGSSSYFTLGSSLFSDRSLEGERTGGHFVTNTIAAELWSKWTMTY